MQWEEIFASNAINKRLTSKIYKQLIYLDNKTTNNPIEKMGRRPKETFLQRRYMNDQQTHENMLINYQINPNQNCNEVPPHTGQNGHYLKA